MLYASDLFRQLGRNQIAVEDNPANPRHGGDNPPS